MAALSASVGNVVAAATDLTPTDFDALLTHGTTRYSQGKQELIIRHFFRDRPDGFYLDVGCYLPRLHSTTYYLEHELNWRGIGVDAEQSYRAAWKRYRPRSKFFAYAVTDKSGETITFFQAGGLSATEIDSKNLKMWQKHKGFETKEVEVPTITMNDLLDREGVKKIDFLSMDINGAEPIALAGFDIKRFAPELVHVEASPHRHEELKAYFAKNDYLRIDEYTKYDRTNWYYTPRK